jgi:hypothetical protein
MKIVLKSTEKVLCAVLGLLALPGAGLAQIEWNNAGGNQLWSNGANWVGGVAPNSWPQIAAIDANLPGPIIDSSVNIPYVGIFGLNIGDSGNGTGTLTMTGGAVNVGTEAEATGAFPGAGWIVIGFGDGTNPNTHGALNMQGGTLSARWDLFVGAHGGGNGTINMTGGRIWAHRLSLGAFAGNGQINLHDGIIAMPFLADTNGNGNYVFIGSGNGNVDIERGQIHILGDFSAQMQYYASHGQITGYQGAKPVSVDYNNIYAGITVVYVESPPVLQIGSPTNGAVSIKSSGNVPNANYVLETTTNLSTAWWPVSTNTAGTDWTCQFADPNATNSFQFYRSRKL